MDGVRLSVDGDDSVEGLADLADWLGREPELRGLITTVGSEPRANELGALTDALVVAVGSGGALSVLVASLKTFLSQPRRSDVCIRIRMSDGSRVEVDAKRVSDVEALVRETLGQGE